MSECQICEEFRAEENNPNLVCGYCQSWAGNAHCADHRSTVRRIEELAEKLDCPGLNKIAEIVEIAEKVDRNECGYTRDDLLDFEIRFP